MGRPKLALRLGTLTILEHTVAALHAAAVDHILIVVGPHAPELVSIAQRTGAHVLALPDATPDMRATIEKGIDWLREQFNPAPLDPLILIPGDHPLLDRSILEKLLHEMRLQHGPAIVVPAFEGKRGHPLVLTWSHTEGIRGLPREVGVNAYVQSQGHAVVEVPVLSAEVVRDLDTPEDYEALLRAWDARHH